MELKLLREGDKCLTDFFYHYKKGCVKFNTFVISAAQKRG